MELNSQIDEAKKNYYLPAFEALDELAAKIGSREFMGASFGDIEVVMNGSAPPDGTRLFEPM